jgi:hypothetical protein
MPAKAVRIAFDAIAPKCRRCNPSATRHHGTGFAAGMLRIRVKATMNAVIRTREKATILFLAPRSIRVFCQ